MVPQFIVKPSSVSITSSTSFAADADLVLPVEANATYYIEMWLKVAAGSTGDIKTMWTGPSGSSGNRTVFGPGTGATVLTTTATTSSNPDADNTLVRLGVHGMGTSITYNGVRDGTNQFNINEVAYITIGATAGNITLNWAQATSNATATTVAGGSLIRGTRVS
jgi:hypothetical protein